MKTAKGRLASAIVALLGAACAHRHPPTPGEVIPSLAGATAVYTLTNLHPDENSMLLYTGNFQQPGLIPVCTQVTFARRGDDWITFRVAPSGQEYEYRSHPVSAEPFVNNLERYFGRACPTAKLEALTPRERDMVRMGVVVAGMSKEAVLLSIGYPPLRDTPTLDRPIWRYWSSRWRFFLLEFDDSGKVATVTY